MEDRVESLRRNYEGFKRSRKDALAVSDEARLVLEEAKRKGDREIMEEVEDKLLDLEFAIEENKCKCYRKCSSC